MPDAWEYVRSAEWVLILWAAGVAAVLVATVQLVRRVRWADLAAVARDEDGAAYTLSYAMAMPIYVLLCLMIVEMTLILLAKIGTVYAAHAAARNNIVYRSLDDAEKAAGAPRARLAAVRAMAPYGSSDKIHLADGQNSSGSGRDADEYVRAARKYEPKLRFTDKAVRDGYLYADKATSVEVRKPGTGPNDPVEVTVTYRVPLRMPVVSRILGKRSPDGGKYYVTEVRSTVKLPDEAAQTRDGKLNIVYDPPPR